LSRIRGERGTAPDSSANRPYPEGKPHGELGIQLSPCYLITYDHVIKGAATGGVKGDRIDGGYIAEVLAEDEELDLALLLVYLNSSAPPDPLQIAVDMPPIGAAVYAIGTPLGLPNTLSPGIISGIRDRGNGIPSLQTTAPISPGSSGGPLLSTDGTVVGVTTSYRTGGQNLNFAVPAPAIWQMLNRPFRPHPNWRGSSLVWEEEFAYIDCKARGITALVDAEQHFKARRFDGALRAISDGRESVPADLDYLAEFTIAKCESALAFEESTRQMQLNSPQSNAHKASQRKQERSRIAAKNALARAVRLNPDFAPAVDAHDLFFRPGVERPTRKLSDGHRFL